jgi:hypothetical protein
MINNKGVSLIAAIFIMVAFSLMGLVAVSLVGTQANISVYAMQSEQALYLAEAGIEYAKRHDLKDDDDWSDNTGIPEASAITIGPGSFYYQYTAQDADDATILFTGKVGVVTRKISLDLVRSLVDGAIYAGGEIQTWNSPGLDIDGDVVPNVNDDDMPSIGSLQAPVTNISGNYTFDSSTPDGNYYITGNLNIDSDVTFNGDVIVEGNISMLNEENITITGSLIAYGNIDFKMTDNVNITGLVYAGGDLSGNFDLKMGANVTITGVVIAGNKVDLKNIDENVTITFDADAVADQLSSGLISGLPNLALSGKWREVT